MQKRERLQWILLSVVVVTIALGWKYPWLGFSVPVVMFSGIIGGFFKGRYVCGNLCPRGSFLDRIIWPLSPRKDIPPFFRNIYFRYSLFVFMMGFMIFKIMQNPSDPMHWGSVFWLMCLVTTSIAIILGVLIHPRSWCSFCPIGTIQNSSGGKKTRLFINKDICIDCKICQKNCPINLKILSFKEKGVFDHPDCLRCSVCINVCPKKALRW